MKGGMGAERGGKKEPGPPRPAPPAAHGGALTLFRSRSFSSRQMENWRFHCSTLAADSCSAVVSRALLSRRVCSSISHFFTLAALRGRGQPVTRAASAVQAAAPSPTGGRGLCHPLAAPRGQHPLPLVGWPASLSSANLSPRRAIKESP